MDWEYQVDFTTEKKIKRITIEDERNSELHTLIDDEYPELMDGVWKGFE
jgi:hypothetical protein